MPSSRRSVAVTVHLSTIRGFLMGPQLSAALGKLACTEEDCSLQLTETPKGNIEVFLKCRRLLHQNGRWRLVADDDAERRTYHAVFENESATVIVEAINRILDVPESQAPYP